MRIATIMSIAVLGLSGAAIAQVATPPDQEMPPMQNDTANNMVAPDDPMANDTMDNGADDMDSTMPDTVPPTAPDTTDPTMPPTTAPIPDGAPTTPDDADTTI